MLFICFRSHLLPPLEVRLEVCRSQPVRVVDVAAHLLPLAVHVANEDDGGELAVPDQLFSVPECQQERRLAQVLSVGNSRFSLLL